jgi:hypothetical protein
MPEAHSTQRIPIIRIVRISDTHELHREVEVPAGDLLIHAGDFSFSQNSALLISNATPLIPARMAAAHQASSRRLGGLSRLPGEFLGKLIHRNLMLQL